MRVTGLKRASVYSYLPYVGLAFNLEQTTVNADRHRLFRKRLKAVEALERCAGTLVVTKCTETTGEAERRIAGKTKYLCKEDADVRYGDLSDETECLWRAVLAFEGYPFRTAGHGKTQGVKFSYQVKRSKDGQPVGEIKVSSKAKTITRATIELAYRRAKEMGGVVTGPKKLGVFGASYLYPLLVRFGVVKG